MTTVIVPELLKVCRSARHVLVLTGAGVSAESGVPTFRDALTGIWKNNRPEDLATPEAFMRNPLHVWRWYEARRSQLGEIEPNPGHYAISALSTFFAKLTLVTQNVDDLHERAGSQGVIHLHGELSRRRCFDCGNPYGAMPDRQEKGGKVPTCHLCGGMIRPGVVWFGEMLPERALRQAENAAQTCDLCFCIGTSSLVYPAAYLPRTAAGNGAVLVQVNPETTDLDAVADFNLRGPSGVVMPELIKRLKAS